MKHQEFPRLFYWKTRIAEKTKQQKPPSNKQRTLCLHDRSEVKVNFLTTTSGATVRDFEYRKLWENCRGGNDGD
jgi:hypothetical protein